MSKREQRRAALRRLIDEKFDGVTAHFAAAVDKDASYITRCLYPETKAGAKKIGEDFIEDIVKALSYARDYFGSAEPDLVLATGISGTLIAELKTGREKVPKGFLTPALKTEKQVELQKIFQSLIETLSDEQASVTAKLLLEFDHCNAQLTELRRALSSRQRVKSKIRSELSP